MYIFDFYECHTSQNAENKKNVNSYENVELNIKNRRYDDNWYLGYFCILTTAMFSKMFQSVKSV
jgi:hypothetical protein